MSSLCLSGVSEFLWRCVLCGCLERVPLKGDLPTKVTDGTKYRCCVHPRTQGLGQYAFLYGQHLIWEHLTPQQIFSLSPSNTHFHRAFLAGCGHSTCIYLHRLWTQRVEYGIRCPEDFLQGVKLRAKIPVSDPKKRWPGSKYLRRNT